MNIGQRVVVNSNTSFLNGKTGTIVKNSWNGGYDVEMDNGDGILWFGRYEVQAI